MNVKTIFISIAVLNAFRNICFFPGSMFYELMDVLKRRKDIRIVFIFQNGDYQKFEWFFESHRGERVIMENVDFDSEKKTFVQKIFRFLYAYLIYTPTTKVVSTIGMRPDSPPGATAPYIGILKWILSRTIGRSKFVKRTIVPKLHYKIFRERPFKALFDTYSPDLVFSTNIYGQFDSLLIGEAKRRGIKTMATPANWDHIDKYFLPFQADMLLVQNPHVKRAAVVHQSYDEFKVHPVGYSYVNFFYRPESKLPREEIIQKIGFAQNARYILYTSGSAYCPDEPDVVEKIIEWIDKGHFGENMYLIMRPYVGGRLKDKALDEKKWEKISKHPKVFMYDGKNWDNMENSIFFLNVIRYASVMMSVYSTIFMEALVFDRPLVAAVFDGYKQRPYHQSIRRFEDFEHFQDFIRFGAIKRTFNFDELREALIGYVKDPNLDKDKRKRAIDEIVYVTDGTANKKAVEMLLKELDR